MEVVTMTGELVEVCVKTPTCPLVFVPQPNKIPPVVLMAIPNDDADPAAIMLQDVAAGPLTITGDDTVVTLLMPTCPLVFWPQPYRTPVVAIAKLKNEPAATAAHDVVAGPLTKTGLDIGDVSELIPT